MSTQVSIIICTCNRAEHLRQTLEALAIVCVPETLPTELIVVDNGSTDGTAALVQSFPLPNMPVRYVFEPKRGLSHARNSGLAAARGDIFLFTDDDLRFPADWITGMCEPILAGRADAVGGGVVLAPHLVRDWMEQKHQNWLASTGSVAAEGNTRLVGANMAFSRTVLEKVPQFDTELGAGALGVGEETLFSFQLKQAGFRVMLVPDVCVEHHFEPSRLTWDSFFSTAQKIGRSSAYSAYHWAHVAPVPAYKHRARQWAYLAFWQLWRRVKPSGPEGMPLWEMGILFRIGFEQQMLIERRRPRNYEKSGLVKVQAKTPPQPPITEAGAKQTLC